MRRPTLLRGLLLTAFVAALAASPAHADAWYRHYDLAEKALAAEDWTAAVEQLNEAIARKGDSGARVRTYGMKLTDYFPYLKLGVAYYHLGQLDAALQAFDTEERLGALAENEAARAELRDGRARVEAARKEETAEEERRIRQIVTATLTEVARLEDRGQLEEALETLGRALAVAPEDAAAQAALARLRTRLAEVRAERQQAERVADRVDEGRRLLDQKKYDEASRTFRQALAEAPGDPRVAVLLDEAQAGLRAQLEQQEEAVPQSRRQTVGDRVLTEFSLERRLAPGDLVLVERILQTIHNNSLLLHGERRIGKTSIQHHLKKRLTAIDDPRFVFHPVYVDLQGTPEARFFATLAEEIFQELAAVTGGLAPSPAAAYGHRELVRDLRQLLQALQAKASKRVKLVLLIDEVDELNDYDPKTNQKLRSLFMKSFAENLAAVVSGVAIKKTWHREASPWYNFFEEIQVEPLRDKDARELVERPIRGLCKLDRGVTDRILALTGARPYFIQKLCMALVQRLYEENRRRITLADVEAVGQPRP